MTPAQSYESLLRARMAENPDPAQFIEEVSSALTAVCNRAADLQAELDRARVLVRLVRERWGLPEARGWSEGAHGELSEWEPAYLPPVSER